MSDTVRLEITQEDIDNGIPSNAQTCPAALAVKRLYPNAEKVVVFPVSGITITYKLLGFIRRTKNIYTPYPLTKWITNFDSSRNPRMAKYTKPVIPATFELEI